MNEVVLYTRRSTDNTVFAEAKPTPFTPTKQDLKSGAVWLGQLQMLVNRKKQLAGE